MTSVPSDVPTTASRLGRLLVFAVVAGALGVLARLTRHPHAVVLFHGYLVGLAALMAYRALARLPGLRRILRPTRVTREGMYFLVLTFVFGAAAVYTGDNMMHLMLSLLAALIIMSGVASGVSLARTRVRRRLAPAYFAGLPGEVELEISNRKWLTPALSVMVEDRHDVGASRRFVLAVPARRSRRAAYELVPERRGRLRLHELRMACRFPFGFFERDRLIVRAQDLLALPRVSPVEPSARPGWDADQRRRAQRLSAYDHGDDFLGLREYRRGDNARQIHWRITARLGTPVVREFLPPDARRVVLLVDSYLPEGADAARAEATEATIRIAASLAWFHLEQGLAVSLVLPGQRPVACAAHDRLPGIRRILERLAVEDNRQTPLAAHLLRSPPGPGWLVPILPVAGEAARQTLAAVGPRRRSWPVFAEDEARLLRTDQAIVPGNPTPVAVPARSAQQAG